MLKQLKIFLKTEIDPAFAKRAEYIFSAIERLRPQKILDAGCGRGFYVKALSFYDFPKEIHGIDINSEYIKKAEKLALSDKRIKIAEGSIYKLPYKDNFFDVVICSEILEHLTDEKKALQEIRRVLKPGGSLIATVPHHNFPFLWDPLNWILMRLFNTHVNKNIWWLAGIWADHEQLYTEKQLREIVSAQGFLVNHTRGFINNCWPFTHFILYGIGKNIVERMGGAQFDRFLFEEKPLSLVLAKIVGFPSKFDGKSKSSAVGLGGVFTKSRA